MAEEGTQRRLAAIVATDMVGYSRLIQADETGTIARQKAHRAELIDPTIARYGGRIVKSTGDGLLIEFPSVVDAVQCAVKVQRAIAEREADLPEDRRIQYRVGINVGDIVIDGDDILGDGVNVAARLETAADPGGICVRREVRNQVRDKLDLSFQDMGEIEVKNINRPIRVFKILLAEESAVGEARSPARRPNRRLIALALVLLLVAAVGGGAWWWRSQPDLAPADRAKMAFTLPDKPSIAVLPFDNLSGDPEQAYFVDGMAEDIITDLSKISGLFVIARNSSFSYKGRQVKIQQVAEELGVRYVLEGSVRRAGDTVRINTQLIDAITGGHLWAERYDGNLADVFALQDQVSAAIVQALAVKLSPGEQAKLGQAETNNPRAHDAFLQGWEYYRRWNLEAFGKAVPHFKRAIELDPKYARAHAALASIYWYSWRRWGESGIILGHPWPAGMGVRQENYYQTLDLAKVHLEESMRRPTPLAHQVAAQMHLKGRRYEAAITEARRAVSLDPGDPDALANLAYVLAFGGDAAAAVPLMERAMRLDPHYPPNYLGIYGIVRFALGEIEEAADLLERRHERNPEDQAMVPFQIAAYALLGRDEEMRKLFDEYDGYKHSITAHYPRWPFKDFDVFERYGRGMVKAGVCCRSELEEMIKDMRASQSDR